MDGENICCFCFSIGDGLKGLGIWNIICCVYIIVHIIDLLRVLGAVAIPFWYIFLDVLRLIPFFMATYLFVQFFRFDTRSNRERLSIAFFLLILSMTIGCLMFIIYPGSWLPFSLGIHLSDGVNIILGVVSYLVWTFFHLYWMKVAKKYASQHGMVLPEGPAPA